jgi:acetolactate synthase small subunit
MRLLAKESMKLKRKAKNSPTEQRKELRMLLKRARLALIRLDRKLERLSRQLKKLARRSGMRSKESSTVKKMERTLLQVGMRPTQREIVQLVETPLVHVVHALSCSTFYTILFIILVRQIF